MSENFTQNALSWGKEGEQWLKDIPQLLQKYEQQWHFTALPPFELSYNYVAPVRMADGSSAVIKIGLPQDKEFQTEIAALEVFNGEGIEKLLAADKSNSIILIEHVTPGKPLSAIEDDDEATQIIASVMKKLHKPLPETHSFISIAEWMRAIPRLQEKYKENEGPLSSRLLNKAHELFVELIHTSEPAILTHGDLHHDNILSSTREGWLAIDPKGIAAEPAYEVAAMIRNPYEKLKDLPNLENILKRRIQILSEELGVDPARIQKWCFAQTVLSAAWNVETAKGPGHAVRVAEALEKIE